MTIISEQNRGKSILSFESGKMIRDKLNRGLISNVRRHIFAFREITLVLVILVFWLVLSNLTSSFQTISNLRAVFLGLSLDAIIAVGMTILLIAGGFDLSVGSVLALGGISSALLVSNGVHPVLSALGGLACGAIVGATNGIIVTKIGVNPLITTLGTMGIARGIVLVLTGGWGVSNLPDNFNIIGQKMILGLQSPIWVMLCLVVTFDFLLRKSRFLRQAFYVGGNEKVAKLSGINVDRIRIFTYIITSILASIAGILTTSRFNGASVTAGVGTELKVIAAVVIGGGSLSGGEGTILGGILGLTLVAFISAGLIAWGIDPDWEGVISGTILIIAVAFDRLVKRKTIM